MSGKGRGHGVYGKDFDQQPVPFRPRGDHRGRSDPVRRGSLRPYFPSTSYFTWNFLAHHQHGESNRPLVRRKHHSFDYDRAKSSPCECYRMCSQFGWYRRPNGSYPRVREEAWQKFRTALVVQGNSSFGVDADDIAIWEGICKFLELRPIPLDIDGMRQVILDTHVNLADMLDSERNSGLVKIFETKDELIDYTIQEGRYLPKEEVYAGGLLRYLLTGIHNNYHGGRGKSVKTRDSARHGRGRV
ncbi:hypothetical protein LTR74_017736 [Friedmanniomyces endolithicus]|nr:hypothetical protein LTR74_017736 [Friedmanniomyces endolithicus]